MQYYRQQKLKLYTPFTYLFVFLCGLTGLTSHFGLHKILIKSPRQWPGPKTLGFGFCQQNYKLMDMFLSLTF